MHVRFLNSQTNQQLGLYLHHNIIYYFNHLVSCMAGCFHNWWIILAKICAEKFSLPRPMHGPVHNICPNEIYNVALLFKF